MVSILWHEQYFFLFHTSSCSSLMSHHHWVNNKCNNSNNNSKRMTLKIANLCPTYFLWHNNVTCFQKQPPLFLKVSQIPQEKNCVGVSFFSLKLWNYIKRFALHEWKWISIQQMWVMQMTQLTGNFFSIYIWGKQNVLFT